MAIKDLDTVHYAAFCIIDLTNALKYLHECDTAWSWAMDWARVFMKSCYYDENASFYESISDFCEEMELVNAKFPPVVKKGDKVHWNNPDIDEDEQCDMNTVYKVLEINFADDFALIKEVKGEAEIKVLPADLSIVTKK